MDRLGNMLLADDSENDRELTRRALKKHQLANEIIEVCDGAEALDYLHRRGGFSSRPPMDPIFVLLDINMPKINGIEVLAEIKREPQLSHIPVVMLTSSRQGPDVDECYRLRANAYVLKPVDFDQFVDAVKTIEKFWAVLNELPRAASNKAASGG